MQTLPGGLAVMGSASTHTPAQETNQLKERETRSHASNLPAHASLQQES